MFKRINRWWESLCNGCGLCCYEKEFNEDDVIFINLEKPCPYLEEDCAGCSVYKDRFKVNPHCKKLNLYEALFNPYLPGSCGYVRAVRFWKRRRGG